MAAVSGGADSVCLLYILAELRDRAGIELRAAHIHHGLRETADRGAAVFVVTHEPDVTHYADEVWRMNAGQLSRFAQQSEPEIDLKKAVESVLNR